MNVITSAQLETLLFWAYQPSVIVIQTNLPGGPSKRVVYGDRVWTNVGRDKEHMVGIWCFTRRAR